MDDEEKLPARGERWGSGLDGSRRLAGEMER